MGNTLAKNYKAVECEKYYHASVKMQTGSDKIKKWEYVQRVFMTPSREKQSDSDTR